MVEFTKVKKCSTKEFELIKITDDVRQFVAQSKIKNGVVYVILSHTTAGIMVNAFPAWKRTLRPRWKIWFPCTKTTRILTFFPAMAPSAGTRRGT